MIQMSENTTNPEAVKDETKKEPDLDEILDKAETLISEVELDGKDDGESETEIKSHYSVEEPGEDEEEKVDDVEVEEELIDIERIEEICTMPSDVTSAENDPVPIVAFPSAADLEGMNAEPPTVDKPNFPESVHISETSHATSPSTAQPATTPSAAETSASDKFRLKSIKFGPITHRIVTQNANGPCPLVSIINALIIKGKLEDIKDRSVISRDQLVQVLAEYLLSAKPANLTEEGDANWSKNLEDVINLLPQICNGLDVNLRFRTISDFEFTPALALFDLVGIDLYHGWVLDPQQKLLMDLIGDLTYNQLVEKICNEKDPNIALYKEFYESSRSQLTIYGLSSLAENLRDGETAVLFRNNHFHTIIKREHDLYTLVTDEGLIRLPIVWESLSDVDGDSAFLTGDFEVFKQEPPLEDGEVVMDEATKAVIAKERRETEEADYKMALRMQQEEDEQAEMMAAAAAADVQAASLSGASQPGQGQSKPDPNAFHPDHQAKKKNDKCVIS